MCSTNPCYNGGSCFPMLNSLNGMNEFSCVCPIGFFGQRCEQMTTTPVIVVVNPCNPQPCYNGGLCKANAETTSYVCICLPGYHGNRCEFVVETTTVRPFNPCDRNPCINSGYCVPNLSQGTYHCVCTESFFGK